MRWVVGGNPVRRRRFMRMAVRRVAGEVLVDAELAMAALVVPPGGIEVYPIEGLRRLPALTASTGTRNAGRPARCCGWRRQTLPSLT